MNLFLVTLMQVVIKSDNFCLSTNSDALIVFLDVHAQMIDKISSMKVSHGRTCVSLYPLRSENEVVMIFSVIIS